jgi:hypothetical protein
MIEIFCGLPGAGKSLTAVRVMREGLEEGRYAGVVTNIELRDDAWPVDLRKKIECVDTWAPWSEWWGAIGRVKGRCLVVMDEAAERLGVTGHGREIEEFHSVLRQSRKLGTDFILVIQRVSFLDRRVRLLADRVLWIIDGRYYRVPGVGIRLPWLAPFVIASELDWSGKPTGRRWYWTRSPLVWELYDSAALARPLAGRDFRSVQARVESKEGFGMGWKFLVLLCLFVCCVNLWFEWRDWKSGKVVSVVAGGGGCGSSGGGAGGSVTSGWLQVLPVRISGYTRDSVGIDGTWYRVGTWSPWGRVCAADETGMICSDGVRVTCLVGEGLTFGDVVATSQFSEVRNQI